MGHEVILTVRTGITGILAKPKFFKPVLHLYEMINVTSGSILPFSKIKAKCSTVNHHNSHKFHQLLCKGPAGPECQVVEHGHVHFLPPGAATTNNWHHKQELEAFLEWLHGSYNLRYNFRKCMIFDACGSCCLQTTSKMVANHLEFHGWYGSFTTFIHP